MTTLHKAAQSALEALEHCREVIVERGLNGNEEFAAKWSLTLPLESSAKAINDLRAALAQNQVVRDDGMPSSKVERELRRMLCIQRHGSRAYMDDGEAQWCGSEGDRSIDYMRETPEAIQQAWHDAGIAALAQEPVQNAMRSAFMRLFNAAVEEPAATPRLVNATRTARGYLFGDGKPLRERQSEAQQGWNEAVAKCDLPAPKHKSAPKISFDDPVVLAVYDILADTDLMPPEGADDHWEGWKARLIAERVHDVMLARVLAVREVRVRFVREDGSQVAESEHPEYTVIHVGQKAAVSVCLGDSAQVKELKAELDKAQEELTCTETEVESLSITADLGLPAEGYECLGDWVRAIKYKLEKP